MKLRYIALHMNDLSGYNDLFRIKFNEHSRFISNYLSIHVRKLKFETDNTFKMISVIPSQKKEAITFQILAENVINATVPFDPKKYEEMGEIEKYEYYLALLEEGYRICAQHKNIPLDELIRLNQQFRDGGYKNEWIHKRKVFKDLGLDITLYCCFTSSEFRLRMGVVNRESKKEFLSGTVLVTPPYEVSYEYLFKDIVYDQDSHSIIITDYFNRPKFIFLINDIFNKRFKFEIIDYKLETEEQNF